MNKVIRTLILIPVALTFGATTLYAQTSTTPSTLNTYSTVRSIGIEWVIVGLCVLSPHPQLLQYTLLTSGAYALFLAFSTLDNIKLQRALAIRRLSAALLAVMDSSFEPRAEFT